MTKRLSYRASLEAYFRAREGRWVSYIVLARIFGLGGWRTRLSECRRWSKMNFENRRVVKANGVVDSQYRYVR